MSEIFVCPPGMLNDRARRALRKDGVIVVETDTPEKCKFLRSTSELDAGDLLWCAARALDSGNKYGETGVVQRETFARNVIEAVKAKHDIECS